MRCLPECYSCLEGLVRRSLLLTDLEPRRHDEILEVALSYLKENFSSNSFSADLAGELQRIIRSKSGNSDPFAKVKKEEISLARHYVEKYSPPVSAPLKELVHFAAKGNGFDFFQDLEMLEKQFQEPVEMACDESTLLGELLKHDKQVLYLADNAGEIFFDLPLVNYLAQLATVYYAVKESPTQNDATLNDLEQSGLFDSFPHVISTGTDSPGLDLKRAAPSFRRLLDQADLIIAKGMAHYETLPEFSLLQPVFLILQVKCEPVAQDSGLPRDSYAAYFLE
ncbi:MAG: DUF89 family protein [Firmicutes bacterium]|nr:DUF89 family protein [Bacillota bacterium]